jgi:hypothetical protein
MTNAHRTNAMPNTIAGRPEGFFIRNRAPQKTQIAPKTYASAGLAGSQGIKLSAL